MSARQHSGLGQRAPLTPICESDGQVLAQTQRAAARLLAEDPELSALPLLRKKVERMTAMASSGI